RLEVSIPYLSKCFKKYNDMNISDYLTSYRISKAKKLMEDNPSMLVASVSEMCGFGSTRTFMRVFKASEGITPGQFRASLGIQE
ncbi:MAG TPA: DNA-binding response regulator, partial [Sphaerochaeta sp.]|nr:DNA-binding response regulator [Sphaerochaeta sp.]